MMGQHIHSAEVPRNFRNLQITNRDALLGPKLADTQMLYLARPLAGAKSSRRGRIRQHHQTGLFATLLHHNFHTFYEGINLSLARRQ